MRLRSFIKFYLLVLLFNICFAGGIPEIRTIPNTTLKGNVRSLEYSLTDGMYQREFPESDLDFHPITSIQSVSIVFGITKIVWKYNHSDQEISKTTTSLRSDVSETIIRPYHSLARSYFRSSFNKVLSSDSGLRVFNKYTYTTPFYKDDERLVSSKSTYVFESKNLIQYSYNRYEPTDSYINIKRGEPYNNKFLEPDYFEEHYYSYQDNILRKEIAYFRNGMMYVKQLIFFDANQNLEKEYKYFQSDTKGTSHIIERQYDYTYDRIGNWVKMNCSIREYTYVTEDGVLIFEENIPELEDISFQHLYTVDRVITYY